MTEKQLGFRDERPLEMEAYIQDIRANRHPLGLLLDHVEDTRNLGALFRLADAARLQHLWMLGDPRTLDSKIVRRVARSTLSYVPYSAIGMKGVQALSRQYSMLALEITAHSIPYMEYEPKPPCILVVGNEKDGVSEELLALCQMSLHVPMYGVNTSMNVAMATAIAAYGLLSRLI